MHAEVLRDEVSRCLKLTCKCFSQNTHIHTPNKYDKILTAACRDGNMDACFTILSISLNVWKNYIKRIGRKESV